MSIPVIFPNYPKVLESLECGPKTTEELNEDCGRGVTSTLYGAEKLGLVKHEKDVRQIDGKEQEVNIYSLLEKGELVLGKLNELVDLLG